MFGQFFVYTPQYWVARGVYRNRLRNRKSLRKHPLDGPGRTGARGWPLRQGVAHYIMRNRCYLHALPRVWSSGHAPLTSLQGRPSQVVVLRFGVQQLDSMVRSNVKSLYLKFQMNKRERKNLTRPKVYGSMEFPFIRYGTLGPLSKRTISARYPDISLVVNHKRNNKYRKVPGLA